MRLRPPSFLDHSYDLIPPRHLGHLDTLLGGMCPIWCGRCEENALEKPPRMVFRDKTLPFPLYGQV